MSYYMLKADAGAVGDNITADDTAITNWFAHGLSTGQPLGAEPGSYLITSAKTFDYNSGVGANGIIMQGSGKQQTIFNAQPVSSCIPFQFQMSGGTTASPATALYSKILDIGFAGNYDGVCVNLGKNDLSDNLGAMEVDVWISNVNTGASVQALQLNYVIQSLFKNSLALCEQVTLGTSLALFQAAFNQFTNCSFGDSGTALYMHGSTYGNVFNACDFDDCQTDLIIDDAGVVDNVWNGGQWAYYSHGVNATAGSGNLINKPHQAAFVGAGAFVGSGTGVTVT